MRIRWVVIAAFGIAVANLALLGVLIGHVGASRAYSVGLHTLFRDHPGSVVISWLPAVVLAAVAARRLTSIGEACLLLVFVVAADVVAGLGVIVAFGEITLVDLPSVLITETVLGTQLLAVGGGVIVGYLARSTRSRTPWRPEP